MENVYYARTSDTVWSEASMDAVEAAMENWESTVANLQRNDAVSLYEIVATDLTSLFGIRKAYAVSPAIGGTLPNPLPANATVAVKADIGRRGRGTSGRTFWIGLAEGQITAPDQLAPLAASGIIAALNTLRDDVAGITPIEGLCVPHFMVDHVRPPSVQADIVVQYLLSDFFLDSQRDRLPGHKKHKKYPIA
jgi:hypothetical protein